MAERATARCPTCRAVYSGVPASAAGQQYRCRRCGRLFTIQIPAKATAPTDPAAPSSPAEQPSNPAAVWRPGNVIASLYEVREVLGAGGMGTVFRVHHRSWDLDLAVKCPQDHILATPGGRTAFEREAETWVNLELHPHIVTCYYVRRINDLPAVFAEYADGGSLLDAIRAGRLRALADIVDVAIQVAWGLDAAHTAGLVHRDVKPANIMLTASRSAKVTDFGLAAARSMPTSTAPTNGDHKPAGGGTPAYCSPEQAAGVSLGRQSDLYSWAASVVEMLRGERTWEYGPAVGEAFDQMRSSGSFVVSDPPHRLLELIARCLASRPEDRPQDLGTVAEELAELYAVTVGEAYPRNRPMLGRRRADTLNNRAVSLLDLGRHQEAEEYWERSLEVAPNHPESTYNLHGERWLRGRLGDDVLLQVMERLDSTPRSRGMLVRVHLALGQTRDAATLLEEATDSEMAVDTALLLTARALDSHTDESAARAARSKIDELLPQHSEDERLLAAARVMAGPEAERHECNNAAAAAAGLTTRTAVLASGATLSTIASRGDRVAAAYGEHVITWSHANPADRRRLRPEGHRVRAIELTTDGALLVASDGAQLQRLDPAGGPTRSAAQPLPGSIIALAASRDGARAFVASSDRKLRVLDIASGTCQHTLVGHQGSLTSVAIDGSGRIGVSGSRDTAVRVWDLDSGTCLATVDNDGVVPDTLTVSSSGELVATGSSDGLVRLWALRTGVCAGRLAGHSGQILTLTLTDERFLVSGGADGRVRVWDLTANRVHAVWTGDAAIRSVLIDGTTVVAAVGPRVVHLGLLERQSVRLAKTLSTPVSSSEATEQEGMYRRKIAAAHRAARQGLWHAVAESLGEARAVPGFERDSTAIELLDDLVRRFPRAEVRSIWQTRRHTSLDATATAVASDRQTILTGHANGVGRVWSHALTSPRNELSGHEAQITAVSLWEGSPVTASLDGTVRSWSVENGECRAVFDGHSDKVLCLTVDAFSSRAASGSADGSIMLWGLPTHGWLNTLEGHDGAVTSVTMTPDGRQLVSVGWDGWIRFWDPSGGRSVGSLRAHTSALTVVRVTPENRTIIVGAGDGAISLWEPGSRRRVRQLEGHREGITALEVTPDGRFLVSSSRDETVRVWDLRNGKCVHAITAHPGGIAALAMTQQRSQLVTVGPDGTLQLWQIEWKPELRAAMSWHESARPFVEVHLARHGLAAASTDPAAIELESTFAQGSGSFQQLMNDLEDHGFGWLDSSGVHKRLMKMVAGIDPKDWSSTGWPSPSQAPLPPPRPAWRQWLTSHPWLAGAVLVAVLVIGGTLIRHLTADSVQLYQQEIDQVRYDVREFYFRLQPFTAASFDCDAAATDVYLNTTLNPDFENPQEYERAVTCLMQVRDPTLVDDIVRRVAAQSETSNTRRKPRFAAGDLACICAAQHSSAVPRLAPLVIDDDHDLRALALQALSLIADESAGEAMVVALTAPIAEVRRDAARNLRTAIGTGALDPTIGLDVTLDLLDDPMPATRRWAVRALPLFNEIEAHAAARRSMLDTDEGVAHAAADATRSLEQHASRALQ